MSFYSLYLKSASKPLLDSAQKIVDSDRSWEEKYDLIFSEEYSKEFSRLNPRFDYCDPDTSYEEDVHAWLNAARYFALWNPDVPMISDPFTAETLIAYLQTFPPKQPLAIFGGDDTYHPIRKPILVNIVRSDQGTLSEVLLIE